MGMAFAFSSFPTFPFTWKTGPDFTFPNQTWNTGGSFPAFTFQIFAF